MPLRKEPPTPRSAAINARLDPTNNTNNASSSLAPLIPFKPGQTSLRKQAILTEDEYTSALSSIIKRDFFPDLDRITAENEYLAAVESEDPTRIRAALNRLLRFDKRVGAASGSQSIREKRRRDVSGATPAVASGRGEWDDTPIASGSSSRIFNPTFTPASTPGLSHDDQLEEQEIASGVEPDLDLSLADFQGRYTSEDNASFSQLLGRDNQIRKRKHAHLFARERASEQRRKHIIQAEERNAQKGRQLAIEANPEHPKLLKQAKATLLIEGSKPGGSEKETEAASNAKDPMDDLILVPEPRQDDRPAPVGLNRWKYTARNALIYAADANESYLHARPSSSAVTANDQPKPTTNFAALRLPEESDLATEERESEREESEADWSPSSSRVNEAIRRGRAGSFTSSIDSSSVAVEETPKVNGYGFVTPYSTPQHGAAQEEEAHLRIYNAIKARRRTEPASSSATSAGGFQLPRLGKREELAQKLTSTASPAAGGTTPYGKAKYTGLTGLKTRAFASPRSTGEKANALIPAARVLLDRSTRGVTPTARRGAPSAPRGETERIGNRGWTPTPR
ncbi:related to protein DGCR14, probably involved in pre-mRNA splicing [Sporisorium scitamineum]|uniref:Related to protein DGCR14, probably involved in pre-mRNA splicing n=1 Tax=Sporisorium scitamineum TaxID=49012 RepID=A0A0F7S1F5_9BASI|nr:hypothetical protein [Sporisorium scitamineum]CDU23333.1 related to protein DGCR14, probably involved in pre-mRNA splicing [Sporisorium scitamineum]